MDTKFKIQIAEERWLKPYCDLHYENGYAIKTFNKNFPKHVDYHWLYYYNKFLEYNDTPVRIHDVKDNKIVMDYIPGSVTAIQYIYREGSSEKRLSKVASCIYKLIHDMFKFSDDYTNYFYHEDLNLTNFVIYEDKITLVDPESFVFRDTVNWNALQQPIMNLAKVSHKIMDKSITETKFY